MTTLFNLCEYKYYITSRKIINLPIPTFGWEYINQEIHIYLSVTTIQIKAPVICSRYNESDQEIHDFWWSAYEKSGDPDDIPF